MQKKWLIGFGVSVWVLAASAFPTHATLIDFTLSQTGAPAHQLILNRPLLVAEPYALDLVTAGPLAGSYASIEPGWDGLGEDRPADGLFGLLSDTGVALQRINFPAGFSILDSGLNPILVNDGDAHEFSGDPEGPGLLWHEHLRFVVDPGAPLGTDFLVDMRLTDLDGLHADSDPFTLHFVVVPEPATLGLLAVIALAACPMRRQSLTSQVTV